MENSLKRGNKPRPCAYVPAGVGVPVEPREVAAGNLQPDPMPLLEHVAGGPEVDGVLVDFAGLDEARRLSRLPIPGANDAVG